jgi:glycosyltransferase involved in cell wall biosynthesis
MTQKYVVLTPFFPTEEDFYGPFIYDQVMAMKELGHHEVIVIKLVGSGVDCIYNYQGVSVYQIKLIDFPSYIFPGLFNNHNGRKILNKLDDIVEGRLDTIKYIHGHVSYPCGILAASLAKRIGAISIIQHHGFDIMGYTNGRIGWFKELNKRWINKFFLPYLNEVNWNVGVSQKTLNELHSISGYIATNEYVLYNGIDANKFYPIPGLRDLSTFTIGCVANFWPIKDQLTLIKAVKLLIENSLFDDIRVKLIGDGETLKLCKDFVIENNLTENIDFLPTKDHTQLNIFYNTLDLFVLPSYYEAFGCVYTEAYACNVPFIGVENQGIEELVLPENKRYQLTVAQQVHELSLKIKYFYLNRGFKPQLNRSVLITDLVKDFLNMLRTNEVYTKI